MSSVGNLQRSSCPSYFLTTNAADAISLKAAHHQPECSGS